MLSRVRSAGLFLLAVLGGPAVLAQMSKLPPDVANYKLSMERIQAYDVMQRKILATLKADPFQGKFETDLDHDAKPGEVVNGLVQQIEKNPKLVALIKAGGFTPREYVVLPIALGAAASAYTAKRAQHREPQYAGPPENLALVEKHGAQLTKMMDRWTIE